MQSNEISLSQTAIKEERFCAICKNKITKDDLVQVTGGIEVHFNCYIEVQEKICVICGKPFRHQEELFYCREHKEYFHSTGDCLKGHMRKHMPFDRVRYDANKNRIISSDLSTEKL